MEKEKVIIILVGGLVAILAFIVIGDFALAFSTGRSINEGVINLLQTSIAGIVGIVGGYFGSKQKKK